MSGEEEFYLFKNISLVGPWDGPQYHIAPVWAFRLQAVFMGFVFFAGTPLNATVLVATLRYKKLRQPLNYILVNVSLGGFIYCISVSSVFIASCHGYFIFGHLICALEAFLGTTAGTAREGDLGETKNCFRIRSRGQNVGLEWAPKRGAGEKRVWCSLSLGYKAAGTRSLTKSQTPHQPLVQSLLYPFLLRRL